MAVGRGRRIALLVTQGLFVLAITGKAPAGRKCMAQSCDKDGNCEDRGCTLMDVATEMKPGSSGRIKSCPG